MSTVTQSANSIKAHLTTLNNYVSTINGEYSAYVNSHNMHTCATAQVQYIDGFRPAGGHSWHVYRDKVGEVAAWVETYVDDSAWVDALEHRSKKWGTASGHTSDAWEDVDSKNLPAVDSWKGDAGKAYREVVPKMQSGTSSAYSGALLMKNASSSISEAGEKFFTDVAAAMATLAGSLTHYAQVGPPRGPNDPPSVGPQGAYSCGLTHANDGAGDHPWTAMTACTDALRALELEVDEGLRVPLPGGPAQGFQGVSDHFADAWPPAPGGH